MTINNRYKIGETVYLVTDPEQYARIITGIKVRPGGLLMYELSCAEEASEHYDFEISDKEDKVIKTR